MKYQQGQIANIFHQIAQTFKNCQTQETTITLQDPAIAFSSLLRKMAEK
jgi:hypothetical protein